MKNSKIYIEPMIFKHLARDTILYRKSKKIYRNYSTEIATETRSTPPIMKEETIIIVLNIKKDQNNYLKMDFSNSLLQFLNNLNYPTKTMLNINFIIFTEKTPLKKTNGKVTEDDISVITKKCIRYNEFLSSFSPSHNFKDFIITCDNYAEVLAKNDEDKKSLSNTQLKDSLTIIKKYLIKMYEGKTSLQDKILNTQTLEQDVITEMISKKQFEELFRNTIKEFHIMKNATDTSKKRKIFTIGVLFMKKISYCSIKQSDLAFINQKEKIIYLNVQEEELKKILTNNTDNEI